MPTVENASTKTLAKSSTMPNCVLVSISEISSTDGIMKQICLRSVCRDLRRIAQTILANRKC